MAFMFIFCLLMNWFLHNCSAEMFDTIEKISSDGYPVEYHEIETEDGYILGTFRIPFGRRSKSRHANKYPVIVLHGLLSSAESFLVLGPDKALGYILPDNGYDVWLCNARGNQHSRKHKSLNPDTDDRFWKFSWHDIGVYDIPATIDYVLNITRKKKLHFVGHSQGTTAFFVMGSERPEYNKKIRIAVALSPPVFFSHVPDNIFQLAMPFMPLIQMITETLRIYEIVPFGLNKVIRQMGQIFCGPRSTILRSCREFITLTSGPNEDQLDLSTVGLLSGTQPGGGSIRQLFHYLQLIQTGRFQKYDWGPQENLRRYGSETPPEYKLKNVVAPVALFYAENDIFTQNGVPRLAKILPNVVELYKVPYENWTHIDFIWGKDVNIYLYKRVLDVMKTYNNA